MNKKMNKIMSKLLIGAIIMVVIYIPFLFLGKNEEVKEERIDFVKKVEIVSLENMGTSTEPIKLVGKVLPINRVDIVASLKGTVRSVIFNIGDEVSLNQILIFLENSLASTNLSSSHVSYMSMLNNLELVKRSADEFVHQAEIGVINASESVKLSEIALQSAKNNYENNKILNEKGGINTKKNAVISFYDYLSYIDSTLDKANYIIHAENGVQLPGIASSLAAKNSQTLIVAKNSYRITRAEYNRIKDIVPIEESIEEDVQKLVTVFSSLRKTINDVVRVLDSTTHNSNFSQNSLDQQRLSFDGLLSGTIGMQSKIKVDLDNLGNLDINNKMLLDSLSSAVLSAQSQLEMVKSSYQNSLITLETAKQNREQQILSAQMSIDNSLSQLNISRDQFGDLTLRAPIKGKITNKFVDLGTEVSPGQKLAEVSQTDQLKIELNLTSEDAYRVKEGDRVIINKELEAEITSVSPVADSVTRKVKAEIIFDNKENELIAGTVVNVTIPVQSMSKKINNSIFIPLKTVSITQSENFVFVVTESTEGMIAKKKEVKIGRNEGTLVEIISGLDGSEELVVEGAKNLEDNELIEIK